MRLQDQVAVVTGAGSGLGAAIVNDRPEVTERVLAAGTAAMMGQAPEPVRVFSALTDEELDRMLRPMEAAKPLLVGRIPARRLGTAEEVAALARYLVCDATYSYGEVVPISGGWLA